ncbi:unnamed protein product, partial [Brassica rapa subsp. trilocularis]
GTATGQCVYTVNLQAAAGSLISESPWSLLSWIYYLINFVYIQLCRLLTFKRVKICILTELLVRSVL